MKSRLLTQYIWLINTLQARGAMTFAEINEAWQTTGPNGDGKTLPKRTFHDHRDAIGEVFGLHIDCKNSSKGYVYYIANPEAIGSNPVGKWLLDSYSVPSLFSTYKAMKDRILLEDIPKGGEHIPCVIEAMEQSRTVRFDYQQFEGRRQTLHMQPYALKVYTHRWYILGLLEESNAIRCLALDRVLDQMKLTMEHFTRPTDFDASAYFEDIIGIYRDPDAQPEKVRIRIYGNKVDYVRSLPLHRSQKEGASRLGEFCDFEYKLCITPELKSLLLSFGENAEILEPSSLREEIKTKLEKSLGRYEKEEKRV